jgi:3-methyladenine DNA glycosylase AlkD
MNTRSISSILGQLRSLGNPKNVAGMARYGIMSKNVLGIPTTELHTIAKEIGRDHTLARQLWKANILEARVLAIFIEEPKRVTERQMDRWAKDFDNWAICDGCCLHLFVHTPFAWKKAREWSKQKEEFVRRAAFALMAVLAVHDKGADDEAFLTLLPLIKKASVDERNGVKKAVNWALRQIGKRNVSLNAKAVALAREIKKTDSPSARWIASDALRELTSAAVFQRLAKKKVRSAPRASASLR